MARSQTRMRVLDSFPQAYWVTGDTGMKQTTKMAWENVYLNAEELAVIVPIPENVLDDADYSVWDEARPRIVEAMGAAFDLAVLFGDGAPAGFPDDILAQATAASHTVNHGANPALDLYDEILGEGGVVSFVEEDGYAVNGHVAALSLRSSMRGLRTSDGMPIFTTAPQETTRYALDGEPVLFPRNGGFDTSEALLISGDWDQLVWSMRQDVRFKIADQASLYDNAGNLILATFQQDAVALRVTMRLAWQLPNPINLVNTNDSTRLPFAALTP
jgi:HK97 family phage major capsid protein